MAEATIEFEAKEYTNLLQSLKQEEYQVLVQGIKKIKQTLVDAPEEKKSLIEDLTKKRNYSRAEKIELEMNTLFYYFQRRRELLENSLTAPQVAKLLGTSRQTPHDRLKNKTLLAVRDNGVLLFPTWQFDPEGADGVIDGLPAVLKSLSIKSEFAKLNWFMCKNAVLDGLTPVAALKQGFKMRVIAEAKGIGGAIW
ncbi:MAG: DNA-binding protein [Gloeocapsa sp. DLM2.Bin57]|nr:MAG: DNA-binding protein [Gloeocapsa sp. DLM2.Bin57]